MKNKGIVQKEAYISISTGLNVSIWDMPWVPLMLGFTPRPNLNLIDHPNFCLANLLLPNARVWNRLLLDDLFDSQLVQCILSIHLLQSFGIDRWILAPSISGLFSVKSAHD